MIHDPSTSSGVTGLYVFRDTGMCLHSKGAVSAREIHPSIIPVQSGECRVGQYMPA